jgi:signal transduction histidine kinase
MSDQTSAQVTAEELLRLALFQEESREAIDWIASRMSTRSYAAGEVFVSTGEPAREFVVILEGSLHFRRTGHDETLIVEAGEVTGSLPYSRMKNWAGRGWAAEATRIAAMDRADLRELVYRAPTLAQKLVSEMTDRAREFTRMEESSNRLLSLGKLAAGLAHQLNNPAAAAVRSSARLREALTERRAWALSLRQRVIPERAGQIMTELGGRITECAAAPAQFDALERSDRESEMADWLAQAGSDEDLAAGLVDAGISVEQLAPLAGLAPATTMTLGLRILVSDHEILCLSRELEESSRRISDLVQAMKSYSYMDQSPVADIDIEQGLDLTLRMFQPQFDLGVQVQRRFCHNLPPLRANGGELNQVWTNLIDNALSAMESSPPGTTAILSVRTCAEPGVILVEIADNGPGIPAEFQNRIFEPFFTTKPVGKGTGLGLDIVHRIVRNHKGSIRVESASGRTVFQIRLPLDRAKSTPTTIEVAQQSPNVVATEHTIS